MARAIGIFVPGLARASVLLLHDEDPALAGTHHAAAPSPKEERAALARAEAIRPGLWEKLRKGGPFEPESDLLAVPLVAGGRMIGRIGERSETALIQKMITDCERQGARLTDLINELLDLNRIRLGHLELHREKVAMIGIVKEAIEKCRTDAHLAPEVSLVTSGEITGEWDAVRIEQVVMNLVSNAFKYGEGRGIEVRIEGDPAGSLARLVVSDRGRGIARGEQRRIFERFERAVSYREITAAA